MAPKQDLPSGCGAELAAFENLRATQESGFDYTEKVASRIGCEFVAVMKLRGIDFEAGIRIPDHQIGVVTGDNPSFLVIEPGETGGSFAEPFGKMRKRKSAKFGFRPHSRKTELQRGNAAPGIQKITAFLAFHLWRAGRVVGGDHVNGSIAQAGPQMFAIFAFPEWRRTFELGRALGNFFRSEDQIMGTRFDT